MEIHAKLLSYATENHKCQPFSCTRGKVKGPTKLLGYILWGPWMSKLNGNPSNSCWDIIEVDWLISWRTDIAI